MLFVLFMYLTKKLKEQIIFYTPVVIFAVLSVWWALINFVFISEDTDIKQLFAASYQILAIYGGVIGFFLARHWGGFKSFLGKSLTYFSLGLFFQAFGQSVYSYFIYFQAIHAPYPSIGDVGFFGSIIFYILGALYLCKVVGVKFSLKSLQGKVLSFVLPLAMLVMSYLFFLKEYEFYWDAPLKIFLDFGYPLGQAIYVSIALLALLMSYRVLGGIMRKPIWFLIGALVVQYISDFMFLYQANAGTWSVGEINDYCYCFSYFLMCISLIYIGNIFNRIKES